MLPKNEICAITVLVKNLNFWFSLLLNITVITEIPGINYCWQCKNEECETSEPKPCSRLQDTGCYSKSVRVDQKLHSMEYGCFAQPSSNRSRGMPCSTRGKADSCTFTCTGSSCNTPQPVTRSPHETPETGPSAEFLTNPAECSKIFVYDKVLYTGCTSKDYQGILFFTYFYVNFLV